MAFNRAAIDDAAENLYNCRIDAARAQNLLNNRISELKKQTDEVSELGRKFQSGGAFPSEATLQREKVVEIILKAPVDQAFSTDRKINTKNTKK